MTSLFDSAEDRPPLAAKLAPVLKSLAERGVFIGTSSWKYPGWCGSIYTGDRYLTRGKFSNAKFERECLAEYAQTFPTVGGDFSFYQFPTADFWSNLMTGLPPAFTFGLKVPETVTVMRWPTHARYGKNAGQNNEQFLDAKLFAEAFAGVLEPYSRHVATYIFEFGTFAKKDFAEPGLFFDRLDLFLDNLPKGWRYAVEIRNKDYFDNAYFDVLRKHNVAHVFNAWTRMPTLGEQIEHDEAFTADFTVTRALLRHGRAYEQAVKLFEPYERVQEPDGPTREALKKIVNRAIDRKERAYQFVNNRLEGHAPGTIEAVVMKT